MDEENGDGGREVDQAVPNGGAVQWPTVDGALGAQQEEPLKLARMFFFGGFFMLPWLWFTNCFYFWPVLRQRQSDPLIRPYLLWSGAGCFAFSTLLMAWAMSFAIGGERLFGSAWKHLAVYDIADKYVLAWNG